MSRREENVLRTGAYRETMRTLKEYEATLLKKIGEIEAKCPACGRPGLKIEDYLYNMPFVGDIILSTGKCSYCGYRYNDVRVVEAKAPQKIVFSVEGVEDLNALVVRASTATIRIPEIGGEIKPGPAAQGFITTIEGILYMFKDILEFLCTTSSDVDRSVCEEKMKWIKEANEGKKKFTLIMEDPDGVSIIVGKKKKPIIEPLET